MKLPILPDVRTTRKDLSKYSSLYRFFISFKRFWSLVTAKSFPRSTKKFFLKNLKYVTRTYSRCECYSGYSGTRCTETDTFPTDPTTDTPEETTTAPVDHCEPNPCLNGASCVSNDVTYFCRCSELFIIINFNCVKLLQNLDLEVTK